VTAPFSWQLPYAWPRKPVLAGNVVATSQPLAAQAGLRMMAEGGNAVDAIVATAVTLTFVEPVSNGIGSGLLRSLEWVTVSPLCGGRLTPRLESDAHTTRLTATHK
jgi:Gamma-glutamyltranspeptidase